MAPNSSLMRSANVRPQDRNMDAIRQSFLDALERLPTDLLASIWILNRIPFPFNGDLESYASWRHALAQDLEVDPSALLITGSAAFGVSLNPNKNYRSFDSSSDIDVAVISDYHFTEGWRTLRNLGPRLHGQPQRTKQAVADHVSRLIYWGTIATDRILPLLPYGIRWNEALNRASQRSPTEGRTINVRVYRDFDSLRAYQVNNLSQLKNAYLAREVN